MCYNTLVELFVRKWTNVSRKVQNFSFNLSVFLILSLVTDNELLNMSYKKNLYKGQEENVFRLHSQIAERETA